MSTCYASGMHRKNPPTVMFRISGEMAGTLDKLSSRMIAFGRRGKIGRATIAYEAMILGIPILRSSMDAVDASESLKAWTVNPENPSVED